MKTLFSLTILFLISWLPPTTFAQVWSIPVLGNGFRTAPVDSNRGFGRGNTFNWSAAEDQISILFHVDQAAEIELGLVAQADREVKLSARVADQKFQVAIESPELIEHQLGKVLISQPGYVQVDLACPDYQTDVRLRLKDLVVRSAQPDLKLDFVRDNRGNMFYWGRRGPSVHLTYVVPRNTPLEYAYSEIRVDPGEDPIGSYFMANGFAEGYFGIQVNSESERRVLFSVWSPFQTDNPQDIPPDQRIEALARGPEVYIGEFGNEGSGGQSYLVYPWQAGKAYRFLTQVTPNGDGSTTYTAWFGEKESDQWRLIASFKRPKTDTHLRRFHSFLESFDPSRGYLQRTGHHRNTWVVDTEGNWHECTQARFSVDPTGGNRHRLDFTGGAIGNEFFMKNCGFFSETGTPGETFERESSADEKPNINFQMLPRE